MQIVIDIPNKAYEKIVKNEYDYGDMNVIIQNGTPLPKEHGRLVDADALPLDAIDDANYGSNYIRIAPTIIEAEVRADKEE